MSRRRKPSSDSRQRWEERRRRQAEWARLTPAQKDHILNTILGAPQRPERTVLQDRARQRRRRATGQEELPL